MSEATNESADVVPGIRPPLFDATSVRATAAPFVAAIAWAGAIFQETVSGSPIDPVALLLRAIALGLTVRSVLAIRLLARRGSLWSRATKHALVLSPESLRLRGRRGETVVGRDDVVAIREHGHWGERSTKHAWDDVYVVLRPRTGRGFVAVPPIFGGSPGELAERLMRWRGAVPADEDREHPPPARLASKVYDDAAAGSPPPGGIAIRHGRRWMMRGPYATVLLGVVIVEGFMRLGPAGWAQMGVVLPAAVGVSLLLVPLVWVWLTRRAIAPRKGLALVLTPSEMLMRTRAGVLRATFKGLARVRIERKPSWSILEGYHQARTLVIERKEDEPIRYDESFLGTPAEVVVALADAYKRGVIPP